MQILSPETTTELQTHPVTDEPLWLSPADAIPATYGGENFVEVTLGDEQVRLLGYDVNVDEAHPGGEVVVTLYWKVLKPFDQNYQAFVHLYDGELIGQHDGMPACDAKPTTGWVPGQIIVDPHIVPISNEARPGKLQVMTGLYNLITQERLQTPNNNDNLIKLQAIKIEAAAE
jgi:hypothetical protein